MHGHRTIARTRVIPRIPLRLLLVIWLAAVAGGCDGVDSADDVESLGIFSDSGETLPPDIETFFGTFSGGGATVEEYTEDLDQKREGERSLRTTVTVSNGGYAGWFISEGDGTRVDDQSFTRDMTEYSGGALILWAKSPIDLLVGIRSGNVTAGRETSTALLSEIAPFHADDTWYRVCVPMDRLEGPAPHADLSRVKVLFFVASNDETGGTGGRARTFWIDDVRWQQTACQ